jgi:hypothetical protein
MDQVNKDLLQLTLMTGDKRQCGRKLGLSRNAMILQLSSQRLQYFKSSEACQRQRAP